MRPFYIMRFEPLKKLRSLEDIERIYVIRTLLTLDWNRSDTARRLGVNVRTLRNKIIKYRTQGYPTTAKEFEQIKQDPTHKDMLCL